ncbi:nucleotide exchange factor GrpE [Alphaproteobacteria bacterium]|nr:nucleotide exchange factor GrpE [Alphaproteobacteria bacterium]
MTQGDDTPKAPEDAPEDYLNAANDAAADFAAEMAADEPGLDAAKSAATALADRVAELEAEAATLKEDRLRALAEAENARRRAQKDREEASRYGAANLARDILSVADNLSRALAAMPADDKAESEALGKLAEGVEMVERELAQALAKHNVAVFGAPGDVFDHNSFQAVFEVETADVPPGAVSQVLQRGYMLHDRLLRPAMVGVAKPPADGTPDGDRGGAVNETA